MSVPTPRPPNRVFGRGLVGRGHPHRRDPAQGDRRRRAAAGRHRGRAGLGQLPGRRLLRRAARLSRSGRASLHLDLSLGTWAADGLLAIFFFVVGLELKREFVAGDLRDPRRAALPILAALGGVVVPAADLRAGQPRTPATAPCSGWAIPTATDIAFALAILADHQHPPAHRLADLPAHPGRRRRPGRGHHHRDLLHRRPRTCSRWPARWSRSASSPWPSSGGSGPGGCCFPWPRSPGCWCTPPASTPPSPGCCSASPSRSSAARLPADPRPAPGWPNTSSTASGRSPPGSPCRSSRSSPPASTIGGLDGLADVADRPDRARHHRRSGARQADRHPRHRPGSRPGSPAPASTTS